MATLAALAPAMRQIWGVGCETDLQCKWICQTLVWANLVLEALTMIPFTDPSLVTSVCKVSVYNTEISYKQSSPS